MRDIDLSFNKVHVIESLAPPDMLTGTKLYDDVMRSACAVHDSLEAELHTVRSPFDFLDVLARIQHATTNEGERPLIHVETHGNKHGLGLADGQGVLPWRKLKRKLTDINVASELNLLIVMSACEGAYLVREMKPTDRAVAWGILGPLKTISAGALRDGFSAFYAELFSSLDVNRAIQCLLAESGGAPINHGLMNAHDIFRRIFESYHRDAFTEDAMRAREQEVVRGVRMLNSDLDEVPDTTLASQFRDLLMATRDEFFAQYAERFFMSDLYPKNRDRFLLEELTVGD
ncbi:MAG: hypothetical protein IH855_05395 [Bacteroidetes bacterium]|nr:hypothetical protein [Bacteroidota bacterium]